MKKFVLYAALLIVLLSLAIGIPFTYLMSRYNYTFFEVINKTAVELKLVNEQERLVNYQQKFENDYLSTFWTNANKSKIFPFLNHKSESEVRSYFSDRLSVLLQQRIFGLKCEALKDRDLLLAYYCVVQDEIGYRTFLNQLLNYSFVQPKEVGSYGNALEFAIAYDLLSSSFSVSTEDDSQLQAKIRFMLSSYLTKLDGDSASLFHGRSVLASNAIILASQLNNSDNKNEHLISRTVGHYQDFYQALKRVEIWPEGYNYWINERALSIVIGLESFKHAVVNEVSRPEEVTLLQRKIAHWHIYNTRPDWTIQGWGDEGPRVDLKDETSKIIDYLALVTEAPEVAVYASLLAKRLATRAYWIGYKKYLPIFATDTWLSDEFSDKKDLNITLEPLRHLLPTTAIFGPGFSNHVVIRSGWGADDTFIQFRASQTFTHHQHYDAGHFTLYKKAPLIVNASTYSGVATKNRMYFSSRSIAKNTIKVMNPNETFQPDRHYEPDNPDGGQRVPLGLGSAVRSFKGWESAFESGKYQNAKLLKYEVDSAQNVLISVDITRSYNSIKYSAASDDTKVSRVVRSFAYIKSVDTAIVYDNVVTTSSQYPVLSSFFVSNKPSFIGQENIRIGNSEDGVSLVSSQNFLIEQNDARLTLSSLISVNSDNILIGGDTYRNFVSNTANLITPAGNIFVDGYENKAWNDKSDWRIEIPFLANKTFSESLIVLRPNSIHTPKLVEASEFMKVWKIDKVALVWLNNESEKKLSIESLDEYEFVIFASDASGVMTIKKEKFADKIVKYDDGISVIDLNSIFK